jgi:hypothetical protein
VLPRLGQGIDQRTVWAIHGKRHIARLGSPASSWKRRSAGIGAGTSNPETSMTRSGTLPLTAGAPWHGFDRKAAGHQVRRRVCNL